MPHTPPQDGSGQPKGACKHRVRTWNEPCHLGAQGQRHDGAEATNTTDFSLRVSQLRPNGTSGGPRHLASNGKLRTCSLAALFGPLRSRVPNNGIPDSGSADQLDSCVSILTSSRLRLPRQLRSNVAKCLLNASARLGRGGKMRRAHRRSVSLGRPRIDLALVVHVNLVATNGQNARSLVHQPQLLHPLRDSCERLRVSNVIHKQRAISIFVINGR
mmetsp:Transcript_53449/g.141994  ORF Transcript_53449/g.141994 Transcript_53449/m.141994 type:complete len:216 (-) Transcript_53449:251-898(-)